MTNHDTTTPPPDAKIRPYRISVPQADIDDLRDRLARTRWTADLPGTGWERGVPVSYVRPRRTPRRSCCCTGGPARLWSSVT